MIGDLIGQILFHHYQIVEEIGQGGMGTVYRGMDTVSNLPVAVKRLKPELLAGNPEVIARFVREGEALRQLNHPNIVKMLESFQERDEYYLIMEFVSGGSLADLLRLKGQLP